MKFYNKIKIKNFRVKCDIKDNYHEFIDLLKKKDCYISIERNDRFIFLNITENVCIGFDSEDIFYNRTRGYEIVDYNSLKEILKGNYEICK